MRLLTRRACVVTHQLMLLLPAVSGVVNALTNANCGNYYASLSKVEILKCLRMRVQSAISTKKKFYILI